MRSCPNKSCDKNLANGCYLRSHSCINCPCHCRECSNKTTKSLESGTAIVPVVNIEDDVLVTRAILASVPDCEGKTYSTFKRYIYITRSFKFYRVKCSRCHFEAVY